MATESSTPAEGDPTQRGAPGEGQGPRPVPERPASLLTAAGLVSILVPCCGQLEYTKLCVPSVFRHTRMPFELIFIDVGSLDGTAEYLAGVAAVASQVRVEVVRTPTDLGIAEAVSQALALARGESLALLNNDTVVTDAWLNQLVSLAGLSPGIGLVGPMSNYAAPPQLVESVPYRIGPRRGAGKLSGAAAGDWLVDVSSVDAFARQWREQNRGKWVEAERLGGFCLLLKRAVLKRIEQTGSLREWTDLGLFDTDVLSQKARVAGFSLACCRDLFVHHFGSRIYAHAAPGGAG